MPSKLAAGVRTTKQLLRAEVTPQYCSVDDAETMTGISRHTWRQWAYKGLITFVKIGGHPGKGGKGTKPQERVGRGGRLLIPLSEIYRILAENTRPRLDGRQPGAPAAESEEARA